MEANLETVQETVIKEGEDAAGEVIQDCNQEEKFDAEKIKRFTTLIKALTALKMSKEDGQPAEVIPNLYIGSIGAAMSKDTLTSLGITHVLMCAANLNPPFEGEFSYMSIPVLDKPKANVMIYFEKASDFVASALDKDGKVLIHCFAGISRSSTFLLAFLMKVKNMTLADAYHLLKSKRAKCEPNIGFMVQLKAYEKTLFGS